MTRASGSAAPGARSGQRAPMDRSSGRSSRVSGRALPRRSGSRLAAVAAEIAARPRLSSKAPSPSARACRPAPRRSGTQRTAARGPQLDDLLPHSGGACPRLETARSRRGLASPQGPTPDWSSCGCGARRWSLRSRGARVCRSRSSARAMIGGLKDPSCFSEAPNGTVTQRARASTGRSLTGDRAAAPGKYVLEDGRGHRGRRWSGSPRSSSERHRCRVGVPQGPRMVRWRLRTRSCSDQLGPGVKESRRWLSIRSSRRSPQLQPGAG